MSLLLQQIPDVATIGSECVLTELAGDVRPARAKVLSQLIEKGHCRADVAVERIVASPVLRDFGRGDPSVEKLTDRDFVVQRQSLAKTFDRLSFRQMPDDFGLRRRRLHRADESCGEHYGDQHPSFSSIVRPHLGTFDATRNSFRAEPDDMGPSQALTSLAVVLALITACVLILGVL